MTRTSTCSPGSTTSGTRCAGRTSRRPAGITFRNEPAELGLAPTIVMLDPPVHTRLRGLIGSAFTPRRVARLEDELRAFVRSRIDLMERKAADGEPVDLHRDFSSPIPTFVLGSLLGIPENERDRFDPWVAGLVRLQNAGFAVDGIGDAAGSVAEMFALLQRRDQDPAPRAARRPARRARGRRDRRRAAHRLGHPRLLLRHGRRRQRHDRQPDLARRHAARRRPPGPRRARRRTRS